MSSRVKGYWFAIKLSPRASFNDFFNNILPFFLSVFLFHSNKHFWNRIFYFYLNKKIRFHLWRFSRRDFSLNWQEWDEINGQRTSSFFFLLGKAFCFYLEWLYSLFFLCKINLFIILFYPSRFKNERVMVFSF